MVGTPATTKPSSAARIVSIACFLALRPIARRLDKQDSTDGIGSKRLIGEMATVTEEIGGAGEVGMVRVGREEWRAESGSETPIPPGTRVRVGDVTGTRVVVFVDSPEATE